MEVSYKFFRPIENSRIDSNKHISLNAMAESHGEQSVIANRHRNQMEIHTDFDILRNAGQCELVKYVTNV